MKNIYTEVINIWWRTDQQPRQAAQRSVASSQSSRVPSPLDRD